MLNGFLQNKIDFIFHNKWKVIVFALTEKRLSLYPNISIVSYHELGTEMLYLIVL